ncbi:hypothetical protein VNI00_002388 [Paramarasmius palmivorus]|uniref:F-box domain-containing protein n=1 Tax=Paramarasmius palmivorus TaxID=297713 RepID=A0AAW0DXJ4_9AGAR
MIPKPSPLLDLPLEVLDNIAFHVACPHLPGLPESLASFLLASRRIYQSLSKSPALHARIFKLKFSHSSISRRAFTPKSSEYSWQLKWYCQILASIQRRSAALPDTQAAFGEHDPEEPSVTELLFGLWLMCLEDDGCNRLQMENAGVYAWVDAFVRTQLYVKASGGWPLQDTRNSCALWVLWYLTTKDRLLNESEQSREQIINLVLPFVTVPYRYPSAFAPPNHYNLPIQSNTAFNDTVDPTDPEGHTFSIPTPHGRYPIYLSSDRVWLHVHFERRTPTTIPLVADSAKLLYFSRREMVPFSIPPHLPHTRQEQTARVRARLEDDARQAGIELTSSELDRRVAAEISPTQEDIHEMNASRLGGILSESESFGKGGGTALSEQAPVVRDSCDRILEVDESGCLSKKWDNDWWRLRQCRSAWAEDSDDTGEAPHGGMMTGTPRQGRVYTPGSLSGLWSGRMLIPSEESLRMILLGGAAEEGQPQVDAEEFGEAVPLPANFGEGMLGLMTVPVYMRLEEHVSYAPNSVIPCAGADSIGRAFDEGLSNGYFPGGMDYKRTTDGDGMLFSIPPSPTSSSPSRKEYLYQTLKPRRRFGRNSGTGGVSNRSSSSPSPSPKRLEPGRFHDEDSCPGCLAREDALRKARKDDEGQMSSSGSSRPGSSTTSLQSSSIYLEEPQNSILDSEEGDECPESIEDVDELPPHDPHKVLDCDGIQDVVVTGETDDRHAQAWNHYSFHGRVRHHDGLVGILRCPRNPRLGNIFFYGTIVGGQNFIGNWRVANVDARLPAWEGAFSLGKKLED